MTMMFDKLCEWWHDDTAGWDVDGAIVGVPEKWVTSDTEGDARKKRRLR